MSSIPAEVIEHTEWRGFDMWMDPGDGEGVIDLLGTDGIYMLNKGVRGLHFPAVDHHYDEPARMAGSRWRGSRVKARDVFWPIMISARTGTGAAAVADWLTVEDRFWAALDPTRTFWWGVRDPIRGTIRRLKLRHQPDEGHVFNHDPAIHALAMYGVNFVAEDGMWEQDPVQVTFRVEPARDFFGGLPLSTNKDENLGHRGPPFHISSGNNLGTAEIMNLGNVKAWPRWRINGPAERGHVGLDGQRITFPFALLEGQQLVIDADPQVQTAMLDGVDRTAELTVVDWAPVPPGERVRLDLNLVGPGSVQVEIVPRFYRAFS